MLWVDKRRIGKLDVPSEAAGTLPWVEDAVVRDFATWDEARAYEARTTQHIGNLPGPAEPGVWVRFDDRRLNIVGEDHTYVDMEQIAAAVRTRSLVYEPFGTDEMLVGGELKKLYLEENKARLEGFGIDLGEDLRPYGGESLLPKIADTVAELIPYFAGTSPMIDMTSGGGRYLGKPDQRYLRLGWGWAKDLVGRHGTAAEKTLTDVVQAVNDLIDPFIAGLPVEGFLGDPLMSGHHDDKYEPLHRLCVAYVPVMIERAHTDGDIPEADRSTLRGMEIDDPEDLQEMFALWRNFYFAKATADAAARRVKYAGMGNTHRKWLIQEGRVPDQSVTVAVTRKYFKPVVEHTDTLRTS